MDCLNSYMKTSMSQRPKNWVFGNLHDKQDIWGYFGDSTTKISPHLPLTTTIPREPKKFGIKSTWS